MERGGIGAGKNLKSSGAVPKAETVPSANARANLSTSGSDMTEQSNKTARKGNAKVGSDEVGVLLFESSVSSSENRRSCAGHKGQ